MGKTGGGRGTNQHQVRGASQQNRAGNPGPSGPGGIGARAEGPTERSPWLIHPCGTLGP